MKNGTAEKDLKMTDYELLMIILTFIGIVISVAKLNR